MKNLFGVYTDVATIDRVREVARESGSTIGNVVSICLQYGLDRISVEALRAYSQEKAEKRVVPGINSGFRKNELLCLEGFRMLKEGETGAFRFSSQDIARKVGLREAIAIDALRQLEMRGIVGHYSEMGEDGLEPQDKWGRPVHAIWHRMDDLRALNERNRLAVEARRLAAESGE